MSLYMLPVSNIADWNDLDEFTQGFIEAAFFTECHCDNPELEHAETGDIAECSMRDIVLDCAEWQTSNAALLSRAYECEDYDEAQAGRDYWFTRNGHGVGYWDRHQLVDDIGEKLTAASEYNELWIYRGDDGKVYFQ